MKNKAIFPAVLLLLIVYFPPSSLSIVCSNGGVPNPNATKCICPTHFTGALCQFISCQNDGVPQNSTGLCHCKNDKYFGDFCEKKRCQFGSLEYKNSTLTQCYCDQFWYGEFCDKPSCLYGEPIYKDRTYKRDSFSEHRNLCYCSHGYGGQFCHKRKCIFGTDVGTYNCDCDPGFIGEICDKIICVHGTRHPHKASLCLCDCGWSGSHCDHRSHFCPSAPGRSVRVSLGLLAVLTLMLLAFVSFYRKRMHRARAELLLSALQYQHTQRRTQRRRQRSNTRHTTVQVQTEEEEETVAINEQPPTYEQCQTDAALPPTYEEATKNRN